MKDAGPVDRTYVTEGALKADVWMSIDVEIASDIGEFASNAEDAEDDPEKEKELEEEGEYEKEEEEEDDEDEEEEQEEE